jgi:hypothetical protein
MAERPILFSAPMVRAILAGTKTQTRRVMSDRHRWHFIEATGDLALCPYGQPGDRLWVREAWSTLPMYDAVKPSDMAPYYAGTIRYKADGHQSGKLRPGMFMPRWASRITLEITGVRVERLQDISEEDAIAEGIEQMPCQVPNTRLWRNYTPGNGWTSRVAIPQNSFRSLWESINGADSWNANPWVWVVEFRRV